MGRIEHIAGKQRKPPADHGIALGLLDKPGAKLGGTTQTLKPGQSIVFSARENQINNLGDGLHVTPAGAASSTSKCLKPMHAGQDGDKNLNQYTITVPKDAKPGSTIHVEAPGSWQARNDPTWHFGFDIKVG